jgi:signal peptidase I
MEWLSQLTEGLANLSVKMVLIAVGVLMIVLALFRLSRSRSHDVAWLIENLQVVLSVVVVVFLVIRPFLFQAFYIPSSSMEPTLMGPQNTGTGPRQTTGDRLLVNKLIYRLGNPKRGDIAVFHAPPEAASPEPNHPEGKEFIKRVVGLPNETIEVVGAQILLDGRPALRLGSDNGGNFTPRDTEHPENSVRGTTAELMGYADSPLRLVAAPTPAITYDSTRVEVNGAVELQDNQGRIREGIGLAGYGAELGVEAKVYSIEGQPRLAVLTGSRMEYVGAHVRVNGVRLVEPYLKETPNYVMAPRLLGPNEYLMLGDNRNNSNDGHVWGPLTRDRIIGRAELLFWPLNRFAVIHWWLLCLLGGFMVSYSVVQRLLLPRAEPHPAAAPTRPAAATPPVAPPSPASLPGVDRLPPVPLAESEQ